MNDKRTATGDIDRLQEIFEIVKSLSSTLELDALLKRIGEAAERLTDSEASSIMLLDDDKRHLYFKVATGEKVAVLKKIRVRLGEGIAGAVAVSKKAEIINDTSKDPRFTGTVDMQSGFSTRSILAVPISFGDDHRLIGVAEVLNKRGNGQYTPRDQRMLESLAGLAAVTIMNAIFNENQRNFFVNMTELLVSAVETVRPRYTGRYWRMTKLATLIGREMGLDSSDEEYRDIYFGSLLHDIGYLSPRFASELEGAGGIMERAQAARVLLTVVNTPEDVLHDRHFQTRGFFVEVEHPVAGRVTQPGAPFRMTATPWSVRRPAPRLGQHNEEIYGGRLGLSREELLVLREQGAI